MFFHGSGANGKTTLLNVISEIFGEYSVTVRFETFKHDEYRRGSDATPDLMLMPGACMLRTTEPEAHTKIAEAMVKSLTGGETIQARAMRQDFFQFDPKFKATLAGNHKPVIKSQDEGIWRRVLMLPFDQSIP